jgi:sigma-B regulation protein RsbU (phosphoserine phosphatase)
MLRTLAVVFALATLAYSLIWMHYIRWQPPVTMGARITFSYVNNKFEIAQVDQDGPAARAGIQPGDDILAVNNVPLGTAQKSRDVLMGLNAGASDLLNPLGALANGHPGDVVTVVLQRKGAAPFTATVPLARAVPGRPATLTQRIASQFLSFYPMPFLIVGVTVLFLRVEDRNAWLLACLFAGFIASAPLIALEAAMEPWLRGFALSYMTLAYGMMPAVFYYFFATFPVSSPIDRRLPWLKTVLMFPSLLVVLPLAIWTFVAGNSHPLWLLLEKARGTWLSGYLRFYGLAPFLLGLASLIWNTLGAPTPEARRRTRVIVWGMIAGFVPIMLLPAIARLFGKDAYELPFWSYAIPILCLFLIPLSFAYAVVKHRVLEIPVMLKLSARYVLVRRGFAFLVIVLALAANLVFTAIALKFFLPGLATSLGVAFGIVLAWVSAPALKRSTDRIDRAFFRGAYDARMILQDLAEKARTVTSRQELASLLAPYLDQALHPSRVSIYLDNGGGRLHNVSTANPGTGGIPADSPSLLRLAREPRIKDRWSDEEDLELASLFGADPPECVVPITGRSGSLLGLVALGPRLSEEPYSGEDKRLLASVASQAGIALENIGLAESMAEQIEAQRRVQQEIQIAREVQSRLLPQDCPPLKTLDYAGHCVQARVVGGDYFDFLDLAPGRVGFVVADISGKGIGGALLMANLQANLRSQYAVALQDLPRLLVSVNRLFFKNTEENRYATLFFATYDDATRRLHYVNCGHNPPLVLRREGSVERLKATATVLGLFPDWQCDAAQCELRPGDALVIYTDGILEATDGSGEEFGERRLLDAACTHSGHDAAQMLDAIEQAVQRFSVGEQGDDLTLLIARAR